MYPLHKMDQKYIVDSLESNNGLTRESKETLVKSINNEIPLYSYQKDYIILCLKYNDDLSPSYKEMLIFKIKEG